MHILRIRNITLLEGSCMNMNIILHELWELRNMQCHWDDNGYNWDKSGITVTLRTLYLAKGKKRPEDNKPVVDWSSHLKIFLHENKIKIGKRLHNCVLCFTNIMC